MLILINFAIGIFFKNLKDVKEGKPGWFEAGTTGRRNRGIGEGESRKFGLKVGCLLGIREADHGRKGSKIMVLPAP